MRGVEKADTYCPGQEVAAAVHPETLSIKTATLKKRMAEQTPVFKISASVFPRARFQTSAGRKRRREKRRHRASLSLVLDFAFFSIFCSIQVAFVYPFRLGEWR